MISKYDRLRMRRKFKARKKRLAETAEFANKEIERHVFRRTHNWQFARRFFISWLVLAGVLAGGLLLQMRSLGAMYLVVSPVSGGVYNEGIVGNIKNINPIFATSSSDMSVSTLLFSPLLTYDKDNQLVGDIAKNWQGDASNKVYTVQLRDDIYWQDGTKLTADDVVFTYQTIQNPDTKSPYYSTWRGIKVQKVNDTLVTFTLPNAYSPFPHLLTNGIIPKHKLADVEKSQLRSNKFNTQEPVGSGPFLFKSVTVTKLPQNQTSEEVQMVKNTRYHRGNVQLDGFTVKTYADDTSLQAALKSKEVIGAVTDAESLPGTGRVLRFTQTSAVMVFMNTQSPLLSDAKMRQALIKATNPATVSGKLDYSTTAVRSPLLRGQIGYDASITQQPPDHEAVNKILNDMGWVWEEGKAYRTKNGEELKLQFVSENTADYSKFAEEIQKQWGEYGIKTNVILEDSNEISTGSLATKDYDVLLYAINIGPDPDVYVYWHSSQAKPDAKPGYNFSLYSSGKADQALEGGRSRSKPEVRAVKYKPFLQAWRDDVPAIGLHQPRLAYSTTIPVYNLEEMTINTAADIFRNVQNWQITTTKTTQK